MIHYGHKKIFFCGDQERNVKMAALPLVALCTLTKEVHHESEKKILVAPFPLRDIVFLFVL
jgi:hypothetical protein